MTEPDLPFTPPPEHIQMIHRQVDLIKRLSDRVVGIGPFGLGLDGLLAFIPGAGGVYGAGAGALLLFNAFRAGASPATIARMAAYLVGDVATGSVPILGDAVDFFFPGHLMAANALQKDMIDKHGPMEPPHLKRVGKASAARRTMSKAGCAVAAIVVLGVLAALFVLAGGAAVRAVGDMWETVRAWAAQL